MDINSFKVLLAISEFETIERNSLFEELRRPKYAPIVMGITHYTKKLVDLELIKIVAEADARKNQQETYAITKEGLAILKKNKAIIAQKESTSSQMTPMDFALFNEALLHLLSEVTALFYNVFIMLSIERSKFFFLRREYLTIMIL